MDVGGVFIPEEEAGIDTQHKSGTLKTKETPVPSAVDLKNFNPL